MSTGSIEITEKDRQKILDALDSDTAPKVGEETGEKRTGIQVPADGTVATLTAKPLPREYVVLRGQENDNDGVGWIYVKNVEATSSEQAIRKTAEDLESQHPVTFVAIPVRSFVPATVSVKTTKTLILS
jgi:hypothetical protein